MVWRLHNARLGYVHQHGRSLVMLDVRKVESGRHSCDDVPTQGQASEMEHSRIQTKSDLPGLCGWSRGRIGQNEIIVSSGMIETSRVIKSRIWIGTMS